jgi:hypothetical protein
MQTREAEPPRRTPLEAVLSRQDQAAHRWLAGLLIAQSDIDPQAAPPPDAEDVPAFESSEG